MCLKLIREKPKDVNMLPVGHLDQLCSKTSPEIKSKLALRPLTWLQGNSNSLWLAMWIQTLMYA